MRKIKHKNKRLNPHWSCDRNKLRLLDLHCSAVTRSRTAARTARSQTSAWTPEGAVATRGATVTTPVMYYEGCFKTLSVTVFPMVSRRRNLIRLASRSCETSFRRKLRRRMERSPPLILLQQRRRTLPSLSSKNLARSLLTTSVTSSVLLRTTISYP